jgi:formate hydrogenlyase subunit 6/NADH:ubiquinone oxidoreductase subunit I
MTRDHETISHSSRFVEWLKPFTFYEIIVRMKATLMDLLPYRSITIQYPHEKEALSDNRRGMLGLRRYDHGKD